MAPWQYGLCCCCPFFSVLYSEGSLLCGPEWSGTHCVYLAGLKLAEPLAFKYLACRVYGYKPHYPEASCFKDLLLFFHRCICGCLCLYVCGHLRRPEEGVGSPGAAVTEGCGLTNVCAGSQAYVLNRSSPCSLTIEPSLQSPVASP